MESNFQSSCLKYLNGLPDCIAENVSGNANQSGRPDLNGCYKGRMFKIELKTGSYKPTKKQLLELRHWYSKGCVVGVVYHMKALKQFFYQDWESYSGKIGYVDTGLESWIKIPNWNKYTQDSR